MKDIDKLFSSNKSWAERMKAENPEFFTNLASQQSPKYLWIGCADSRVPANVIVGLQPGELFVHRNIANLVIHTDLNCLSVLQFAVEILKVEHVIVCGHYGCGGIDAALSGDEFGLVDNWLGHIQDVASKYKEELDRHSNKSERLCELNVLEQADNVRRTSVVKSAWARKQPLLIHSWIYSLKDGCLKDLGGAK